MERSAERWMPAPSTAQRQSDQPSQGDVSPSFPRVPRRKLSPPSHKPNEGETTAPSVPYPNNDRPSLPVRTKSPLIQGRELQEESSPSSQSPSSIRQLSESSSTTPPPPATVDSSLPPSPMRRSSLKRNNALPSIPRRKRSLLSQSGLMEDAEGEGETTIDQERSGWETGSESPSRRPTLPRRKSSFEILPARLPSRQSSFELRHRLHVSTSDHKFEDLVYSSRTLKQSSSLPLTQRKLSDKAAHSSSWSNSPSTRFKKDDVSLHSHAEIDETDDIHTETEIEETGSYPPTKREKAEEDISADAAMSKSKKYEKRERAVQALVERPRRSTKPSLPTRQWSLDSASSCDSTGGAKSRFRRFRRPPSLPVRQSSFDLSEKQKKRGRLPGRQSSFPGLNSSFQKL